MNDTTTLRKLIIENPELPLLIFCGEDSWHDEHPYEQADASGGEIKELTLYKDWWMDKDDYEEILAKDLSGQEEYKYMSDKEFDKMINQEIENTEFAKAIVLYVG